MQNFEQRGYSREEIIDVVLSRGQPRTIDFKFELVNKLNRDFITNLNKVENFSISFDSNAQIKRTAKMETSQTEYYVETYMTWATFGTLYWSMV